MKEYYDKLYDIPEDNGKGDKSPIAKLINCLEKDKEITDKEKIAYLIKLAIFLNIRLKDIKVANEHIAKQL
jgi:hypothetical protein